MSGRRKRILVLDASESVLMGLERLLEDAGFETTTTWEMREALHLLGAYRYDLVLVGEHPPEVDAAEVLRQLQYSRLSAPCVVLLAGGSPSAAEYFYSLGASEVIGNWQDADLVNRLRERFAVRARVATA